MMKVREKCGMEKESRIAGGEMMGENDGREWDAVLETLIDIAATQANCLK
jgi:hypothetical protein